MNHYDAIIIGAGFSGLYQLHFLRENLGLNVKILETADNVGGTWFWNRYPGSRCDTESKAYTYYFSKELYEDWNWSERYPNQPEIEKYLNYVCDKLDLRKDIEFQTKVTDLIYDNERKTWTTLTNNKEKFSSKFIISAVGCLSYANMPVIPNKNKFQGEIYHTGDWPKIEPELANKNIGIIGTGSTGIQVIPEVAKLAKKLTVFQRTPNYSVPANNYKLTQNQKNQANIDFHKSKELMFQHRGGHPWTHSHISAKATEVTKRNALYEKAWANGGLSFRDTFSDLSIDADSNLTASQFIINKIKKIIKNPDTAAMLTDFDHPFGSKRPPIDTNYYETFNRKNVDLINIRKDPIKSFKTNGITTEKNDYELEVLIFATGFDALTGTLLNMNIIGDNNISLKNIWQTGPKTNLGLLVPNFPNLFLITGPGSPAVLTNMPRAIEQHVEWIGNCIKYMLKNDYDSIQTTVEAADDWTENVQEAVKDNFFLSAKHSWYLGGNIPGKPKIFIPYAGGLNKYREICDLVAQNDYKGCIFTKTT